MDVIATNTLNGISYAFILFLLASGMSLIFGVMGIVNMAQGSLYMLGAYLGLTVVQGVNNFAIAALAGLAGACMVGFLIERFFLSRLHKQFNEQALLTLGFVYIIGNLTLWIWGPEPKIGKAPPFLSGSISIGEYLFPIYRLGLIVAGLAVFFLLWWLQDKTRIGSRVRAGMDDKETTIGLGINYILISTAIFVVGAGLGGLAGFLGTPLLGTYPDQSMPVLLLSMIVVVVGGVGSVQGALLGSLVIGIIQTFGNLYFPDFSLFTVYLIFIIMLLFRPKGLLGKQTR